MYCIGNVSLKENDSNDKYHKMSSVLVLKLRCLQKCLNMDMEYYQIKDAFIVIRFQETINSKHLEFYS